MDNMDKDSEKHSNVNKIYIDSIVEVNIESRLRGDSMGHSLDLYYETRLSLIYFWLIHTAGHQLLET